MSESTQTEIQPASADRHTWRGAEQLRPYLCRISQLRPTPGNPDKGKAHVGQLMGSLTRFGQTRAILIDAADGATIRAGHHLTKAAKELGWTHIAAISAEFGDEGEALAYLLADNRLARIGDAEAKAIEQLTIIDLVGHDKLAGTGWDLDSVETLRSEAGAEPVVIEQEPWGGAAEETAKEAAARAKAQEGYVPDKRVALAMTQAEHEKFEEHTRLLREAWGVKGVVAPVLRALEEAYDREAAPVGGQAASEGAAPAPPTSPEVEPETAPQSAEDEIPE